MTTILTILLALASGTAQNAEQLPSSGPLPEVGHSTIGYPTVAKALLALRQKPGTKVTERDGWTIVQEEEPGNDSFALWSFTPAGHPAHPAVAKRTVFQKDGHVWIDLSVQCEATKEACDQLVRDFQELNDRMKQSLGPQH